MYCIPCRDCNSTYIGETSRTGTIRIKEHERPFNSGDVNSISVCHALENYHVTNFDEVKVLVQVLISTI